VKGCASCSFERMKIKLIAFDGVVESPEGPKEYHKEKQKNIFFLFLFFLFR
jgi:hypothetical protein